MSGKSKEQVESELRNGPVRRMGSLVAENLFTDPDFQRVMNNWMIRTHILWGLSLATFLIGLTQGIGWLQGAYGVTNFQTFVVLTLIGGAYLLYQTRKFRKPKSSEFTSANPS